MRLEATVSGLPDRGPEGIEAWIELPAEAVPAEDPDHERTRTGDASPWLAALLPAAVSLGVPIEIEGHVSSRLISGAEKAMGVWHRWDRMLRPVEIRAETREDSTPAAGLGCFFSGGVDSSYSVLKALRDPRSSSPTHLIFAAGLDVPLASHALLEQISANLERVAGQLGVSLVMLATNLREVTDPHADWGRLQHGPLLAALGLALSPTLGRVVIPATNTFDTLFPWGSHPLVDPLWSTGATDFIHDGCEASRMEKILWQVAGSDVMLSGLRVCYKNPDQVYNCGKCEKCVRTMLALEAAGALERCPTFDGELTSSSVRSIDVSDAQAYRHALDNLRGLEQAGVAPEHQDALRAAMRRRRRLRPLLNRGVRRAGLVRRRIRARLS